MWWCISWHRDNYRKAIASINTWFCQRTEKENVHKDTIFNHLESEDLLQFGIIPELIGRVSVIAPMHALSEQNMAQILQNLKMQSLNNINR